MPNSEDESESILSELFFHLASNDSEGWLLFCQTAPKEAVQSRKLFSCPHGLPHRIWDSYWFHAEISLFGFREPYQDSQTQWIDDVFLLSLLTGHSSDQQLKLFQRPIHAPGLIFHLRIPFLLLLALPT